MKRIPEISQENNEKINRENSTICSLSTSPVFDLTNSSIGVKLEPFFMYFVIRWPVHQ